MAVTKNTLKAAARKEALARLSGERVDRPDNHLRAAIPGLGTDTADPVIVSWTAEITGRDPYFDSDHLLARVNNARCRSFLLRWAIREANERAAAS